MKAMPNTRNIPNTIHSHTSAILFTIMVVWMPREATTSTIAKKIKHHAHTGPRERIDEAVQQR